MFNRQNLVEELRKELSPERLERMVDSLESDGKLNEFLKLIGREELAGTGSEHPPFVHRKIAVLGGSMAKSQHLLGIAKQLGFQKNQFEFCLSYDEMKTYHFDKLRNSAKYAAIVVGPIPHSTTGTGNYRSVITAMEKDKDYPPVFRVEKITRSSFRNVVTQIKQLKIAVA